MNYNPYEPPKTSAINIASDGWKPNKWGATILGFFVQFLGMLYLANWKLAIGYFLAAIIAGILDLIAINNGVLKYISISLLLMVVGAIHAFLLAKNFTPTKERPWYSKWYSLASILVLLFLFVFLLEKFFYKAYNMPADSMAPTIKVGNKILVKKNYSTTLLRRGQVVVFEYPHNRSAVYVKRVIGLPGDIIKYKDKRIFINNNLITLEKQERLADGAYIYKEVIDNTSYKIMLYPKTQGTDKVYIVPDGHFFTLGDNRDNSSDSRAWGYVPYENLVGKVIHIFN